ncbi:hypothetical protein ACFV4H_31290 [Streptomyces cellulosae]|uniref:hypothetical protein n=1 Tax=Streptomyces sp. McG7 TaxID=2725486 RepID=UPI001BEC0396|nr:hypothetical protein [Streptomyces sp. McG7]WSB91230.1 hypothetical protein OG805_11855 [Streptomyces cellulosae]
MGLDITVVIADRSWLARVPPRERLPRLRNAWHTWYADAPAGDEGWARPQGRDSSVFAVYEFPDTLGSFKPHFWAGHRWERVRDHVAPSLRTELDALLSALVWDGPDGEAEHTDTGFFGEGGKGVLLARSPESVRELAAAWGRARPHLDELHGPFAEHAAVPDAWISDFDAFVDLLTQWGDVLIEAARRGWCVVGLSE